MSALTYSAILAALVITLFAGAFYIEHRTNARAKQRVTRMGRNEGGYVVPMALAIIAIIFGGAVLLGTSLAGSTALKALMSMIATGS